ncbi:hypothetical protein [Halolamina rubra]|uniref:hypothetical protein n=1 Tax=Halolamina rubra TaxID=1380430 RepID=UPI0009E5558A|nr:hypothetical protein [Halolamina rubra]
MSDQPRRFELVRDEDVSGTSGTGVVANGVLFPEPNGRAVLGWDTDVNSVAVYDSIEELEEIHGHEGRTRVEFVDDDPS